MKPAAVTACELHVGDSLRIGETQMRVEAPVTASDPATVATLPLPIAVSKRPVLKTAAQLQDLKGNKLSHYDIGDVIAKGHSGLIFKARDFKNDRTVALKVLWPEFSQNEDDIQRFIRAMKTMMPLRHANLLTLYGAGKSGPYCWIAMELVRGESLTRVIERIGTANMLDWKRALRIGYYLGKALDYAHGQNIIHRNLTPQNVMVCKTPETTKLGDLVLAKAQEGGMAQQITKPGEILGDIRYMSPERTGDAKADARSDLYSLGALMYAMLTGRPPMEGNTLIETLTKIRQADPVRPKKYHLAVPDSFEGVVLKLLAKRPEDRYPTATGLLREMDRVAKWHNVEI